jgi:hypothetical protein
MTEYQEAALLKLRGTVIRLKMIIDARVGGNYNALSTAVSAVEFAIKVWRAMEEENDTTEKR